MASTDDSDFDQTLASLKDQEAELLSKRLQQQQIEERIKIHQKSTSEKERANQLKTQDLIKREQKTVQDIQLFNKEKQSFEKIKEQFFAQRQKRARIIIPTILLACIASGYFAFEQLGKKDKQITSASKNIDKLARILSFTQAEMLRNSRDLENEKIQLATTQKMLFELKRTTEGLQSDIHQMTNDPATDAFEKHLLTVPIGMLSVQLESLNTQFEKVYFGKKLVEARNNSKGLNLTKFEVVLPSPSINIDTPVMSHTRDKAAETQDYLGGLKNETQNSETNRNRSKLETDKLTEQYQKMSQY